MKNLVTIFLLFITAATGYSQILFPKVIKSVPNTGFCMDCGDIKAEKDSLQFSNLLKFIASHNYINKTKGVVKFQILIDSVGLGRVLSHTDTTNSILTQNIAHALNSFKGWKPASSEPLVSVVVAMAINNGKIAGEIERLSENDNQFLADNAGTFYNTGLSAFTRNKSFISRKTSFGFRNNSRTKNFFNSLITAIGLSLYENSEQSYPNASLMPLRRETYDPFNFNKNLPRITIQQNQVNQFWLAPLKIQLKNPGQ